MHALHCKANAFSLVHDFSSKAIVFFGSYAFHFQTIAVSLDPMFCRSEINAFSFVPLPFVVKPVLSRLFLWFLHS